MEDYKGLEESSKSSDSVDDNPAPTTLARIQRWRQRDWAFLLPIVLCIYSLAKEFKVGEPFTFKYQTTYLNLTLEQLSGEVYPYYPYAYLLILIPIFLLTDLLLYKPIVLAEVFGQIGYRSSQVFGSSIVSQQIGQICYGMATASEIAFSGYIYAKLKKDQYQQLTSWTRACIMGGRTFGYLTSQAIILSGIGTYRTLNEIALIIPCIILFIALGLPAVSWKQMVLRMAEHKKTPKPNQRPRPLPLSYPQYIVYRARKLWSDLKKIYSIGFIRKWSFYWAMTTCMSLQVALYAQALWGEVQQGVASPLNGFAEAGYTFTATFAILAMNMVPINWDKWGEITLIAISCIDAGLLFLYSKTTSIYVMYGCYIGYRSLYQVMMTIAQWNIAQKMVCESYGLVFGVNFFASLIMQSVLMIVIADKHGLAMSVRSQFMVYGYCHLFIAFVFVLSVLYGLSRLLLCPQRVEEEEEAKAVSRTASRTASRCASRTASHKSTRVTPLELNAASVQMDTDPGAVEAATAAKYAPDRAEEFDFDYEIDSLESESSGDGLPFVGTNGGIEGAAFASSFSQSFSKLSVIEK